jgi:hypothetical protein
MASGSGGTRAGESSTPGGWREPPRKMPPDIPHILPHEKVFPIQIGSELFRLSGASISSDGQYYPHLSRYFLLRNCSAVELFRELYMPLLESGFC